MPVIAAPRRLLIALAACALALVPLATSAQEASPGPSPAISPAPVASPAASAVPAPTSPAGRWVVDAYDGWGGGLVEPRRGSDLALSLLDDGRVEGTTGCGRYNGGWSLEAGQLRVGLSPTGFVDCGRKKTEEAVAFSVALEAVAGWRATDVGLELLDASGTPRIVLSRESAGEPVGAWAVERYRRPNGAMTEPMAERPMTLTLANGGTAEGSTGCRPFEGAYTREGSGIAIGPIETVGTPCKGDERRAERQLLKAFGEVVYWEREGDALSLRDGFDEPLVELAAVVEDGE